MSRSADILLVNAERPAGELFRRRDEVEVGRIHRELALLLWSAGETVEVVELEKRLKNQENERTVLGLAVTSPLRFCHCPPRRFVRFR